MRSLIIDDIHFSFIEKLKDKGFVIDYRPEITEEEVYKIIKDYDGLVLRSKMRVEAGLLRNSNLKFVARAGAGVDNIDEATLQELGIPLFSASEGNRDAVAEHAVGMILSLFAKLHQGDQEVRNFEWNREKNRGIELQGRTVGIIGYGNIGSAFAQRLRGFGCKIIAYDKYRTDFSDDWVQEVSLEHLQREAEVISLHVPLTAETKGMIDREFISKREFPFWLINTARGPVVDLRDVKDALQSGQLLGAGLDVLENEKFETLTLEEQKLYKELFRLPNVILTPHVAGWSVESYEKISIVLADKIISYFN